MHHTFEAIGVSNKETLMETKKYLLPGFICPMMTITSIVFLCQSIYEILHASTFMSIFFIFLALLVYLIYRHKLISIVNRYMQSMKGYMHTENMVYKLRFDDEYLCVSINEADINIQIPYSDFVKIIETENHYFMKTKAGNPVIITKHSLSNVSKENLKIFLKKKCTNVKKIKLRQ
ncbi:YcxB family protein [Clostridium boliviensis]|uniref:YcxB family protein n=1 Tax=Clostridium boliviensis TaxID=318465 RepID=A0ABU4GJB2_9CLOT|nr:YcxB family protein [Clostridium boliviensis]MDW2797693.1 YcxB family protein [Clostridium boliviensis]